MAERIASLAQYARRCGAQGILYTCSAFGDVIERVQRAESIPVLKPNEAMFLEAARSTTACWPSARRGWRAAMR